LFKSKRNGFIILLWSVVTLALSGCSASSQEPVLVFREKSVLTTKEEALARAQELFPDLVHNDFEVENSPETEAKMGIKTPYFETTWFLHGEAADKKGYINIQLSEDGLLNSFSYYPNKAPDTNFQQLLSREEAQKIAYDFACKYYPDEMASMVPDTDQFEYANDSHLNLGYTFGWTRVINNVPAPGSGIGVVVDALTGQVTDFDSSWYPAIPAPEKTVSMEELSRRIIDQVGLHLYYSLDNSEGLPTAKLRYAPNTYQNVFDALSGSPSDFFGGKITWAQSKTFNRRFTPVPAPEQRVAVSLPGKRKTFKEGEAIAAAFLKQFGYEGKLHKAGWRRSDDPPYPEEIWHYRLDHDYNSPWEDVEVSVETTYGKVVSFSRKLKEDQSKASGLRLSRGEAQKLAIEFLTDIGENVSNMVLQQDPTNLLYSLHFQKRNYYHFRWVRLVNGIPFYEDLIRVVVSQETGDILEYERNIPKVAIFESTIGILSPEEAAAVWTAANPFELNYGVTGNPLKEQLKLSLVYRLKSISIDAHTGKIIENTFPEKRLGPYLAKIKGHWAEIPLGLLAQTGELPAPEDFDPDNTVTRREYLRILELAGYVGEKYEEVGLYSPFSDVSVNDLDIWAILHAVWCGIIKTGGNLRPDEPLTREEAVVWLINLIENVQGTIPTGKTSTPSNLKFTDVQSISEGKKGPIAVAADLNLIGADQNQSFRPQALITWAELATMVTRAIPMLERY